jgi:very-short-patch-repair endonuclease
MRGADTQTTNRARSLRRKKTSAEAMLWQALRNRELARQKFLRQEPIGPYFADFCCRERKLIIELDGATHSTDAELARDAKRTRFFESQNYRVIRFTNADVYSDIESVTNTILAALGEPW